MKIGLGLDGWWLVVFHNIEILKSGILSTRFSFPLHSNFYQLKTLIFFVVFSFHINIPHTLITCQVHVQFFEGATLLANISSNEVGFMLYENLRSIYIRVWIWQTWDSKHLFMDFTSKCMIDDWFLEWRGCHISRPSSFCTLDLDPNTQFLGSKIFLSTYRIALPQNFYALRGFAIFNFYIANATYSNKIVWLQFESILVTWPRPSCWLTYQFTQNNRNKFCNEDNLALKAR